MLINKNSKCAGMMKYFFIIMLFLISLTCTALAKEVTVEGFGATRDEALKKAERNAVEQVVGTFIDSQVLVENSILKLDEIYTHAQGYVNNVQILSEVKTPEGGYMVTARMNVESEANTSLLKNLEAVMRLNDPRIAVIMLKDNAAAGTHDELSESALNDKLLTLGFNHVVDADIVANLENARLLERIYNGEKGLVGVGSSYGADYLVLGVTHASADSIKLPNYGSGGGYINHPMNHGSADLTAKIIKLSTGDIVGTFSVNGMGNNISADTAERSAIKTASEKAAIELEKKFKKLAMVVS